MSGSTSTDHTRVVSEARFGTTEDGASGLGGERDENATPKVKCSPESMRPPVEMHRPNQPTRAEMEAMDLRRFLAALGGEDLADFATAAAKMRLSISKLATA